MRRASRGRDDSNVQKERRHTLAAFPQISSVSAASSVDRHVASILVVTSKAVGGHFYRLRLASHYVFFLSSRSPNLRSHGKGSFSSLRDSASKRFCVSVMGTIGLGCARRVFKSHLSAFLPQNSTSAFFFPPILALLFKRRRNDFGNSNCDFYALNIAMAIYYMTL